MSDRFVTRREALALALAAAESLVRPARASEIANVRRQSGGPGTASPGLIIRNARPLDAESPIEALRTLDTSNDLFFVRSHLAVPAEVSSPWTLSIDGEVERPLTLGLDEVRRLRAERRRVTIECAGNGRGRFALPTTSGVQWEFGAVSTATWTGVPLAVLLERAGVRTTALHFWMAGADRGPNPATPAFLRSIPREIALGDALVAYEMNGQPLPLQHGGPLRLVVPRWYGMASTKWLTHVHARATESDNHFMARGYRYADGSPVDLMRVKSLITSPLEGQKIALGEARVTGVAWTGTGSVERVEVSGDGGRSWQQARFTSEAQAGSWRLWETDVAIRSTGVQSVRARATDTAGHTQPEQATPNPAGYGNNSIHEVRVHAS
jgi:DMSO/TMAO reductase YedYZ molybdopterin-dependent catalytic subunit